MLISLREDFLPPLEELRTRMPSIARNRLRLNQLSGAQALEAIFKPGRDLVSEEVAIEIIGFITGKTIPLSEGERNAALKQLQVEPALLNLVCQELNERRQAQDLATISTDLLKGTKDRILADFYERCLKDLGPEVRQFIEEYLLTESGYRRAETLDDALRVAGVKEAAIITLVDRRVLRREERLGIPHIELIHDVLIPIVRERRELRRRKEAGRKRRIGIGIGIFAIISALVVGAIFAGLYFLAEEQRIRAEKSRQRAEELINFMLFDLRDTLTQLGRLDLLDTVASRSLKYFESMPEAELSEESIRNRGVALHNIGDVLKAKGDLIGALQNFLAGKAIFERLIAQDPSNNTGWQRDLALSYQRIGDAFSVQGNQAEALKSHEAAKAILERLTAQDPSNTGWQRELALSYQGIGDAFSAQGNQAEALKSHEAAKAILERLTAQDPSNTGWQPDLTLRSYQRIDDAQRNQAEAQAAQRIAEEKRLTEEAKQKRLAEEQRRGTQAAQIEALLSKARQALKENRLGTPAGDNAVEYAEQLLALAPKQGDARQILIEVVGRYVTLGEIALSRDKLREAQRHRNRTLELTKRYGLTDVELRSFSERIASIQRRLEEQARRRAEEAQRAAEKRRQLRKERERLRAGKARPIEQVRQPPPPAPDRRIFIPPSF